MVKEYKTVTDIAGPLIFVEKTEPVGTTNSLRFNSAIADADEDKSSTLRQRP
jgi:vacuolar-type H+-ATPase subunit B/Vma2